MSPKLIEIWGLGPDGLTCHCKEGRNCPSPGKHPRGGTLTPYEPDKAAKGGRVAALTGRPSGYFVMDVDPRGKEAWETLMSEHGGLDDTQVNSTPRGCHILVAMPEGFDVRNRQNWPVDGVDIRGTGGYHLVPPSRGYEVARHEGVIAAPRTWLLDMLRAEMVKEPKEAVPSAPKDSHLVEKHRAYSDGALARITGTLTAKRDKVWEPGDGWDEACYGLAKDLVRLSNSPWCHLTHQEAREAYMDAGPRDSRWDKRAEKWERAVAEVGNEARKAPELTDNTRWLDELENEQAARSTETTSCTLEDAHTVARRWLGDQYDLQIMDAVLATAAAERLDGDPAWLLIVNGSGGTKTETVAPLAAVGAHVTSTIASEGALLSATATKDRTRNATGGLLRKIGPTGLLVIKDVTSILSMSGDARASVLAALREVYDGKWERNVGTDGGRTLTWEGRIVTIGAVTTAWDTAHAVIAAMGDRFVLIRGDSTKGRLATGRQALRNTGHETQMRTELAQAYAGVVAGMDTTPVVLTESEEERLLAAADLVSLARTAVEYDRRGEVVDAHAPEAPTRFAKQLQQIVRGACAIGMPRRDALSLAIRCARDSMPPLRLAIIDDIAANQDALTASVARRIDKPRTTVDRQLQALHMIGVLTRADVPTSGGGSLWGYRLANGIDPTTLTLKPSPETAVPGDAGDKKAPPASAFEPLLHRGPAESGDPSPKVSDDFEAFFATSGAAR